MISSGSLRPAVVLVADRTLSAKYDILFEGIFATMQTTHIPEVAVRNFVAPKVRVDGNGRALTAPLGLRRVESALVEYTDLGAGDVVCTTPEYLPKLLGPWVKVVGVSSSDPLGHGMSNTTTTSFWDGELYTRFWTRRLLETISKARENYGFKVVGGGAGAWQWKQYPDETAEKCIDVIFEGNFERQGPGLFADIIADREVAGHVVEKTSAAEMVCPLRGASLLGIVELSRGCGRGCTFCPMGTKKMEHLSHDIILADLETNVANGISSVVSGSEDFFRYGAEGIKPDAAKLCELLEKMQRVKGLSFMQIDHGNVTSAAQLADSELREIRRLLTWEKPSEYLWVNMGVESANGQLVAENCRGKVSPYQPDEWEDIVREVVDKMSRTGFFSVISLILGLPGETPDDVERTMELVKYLENKRAVIFPVFYEPFREEDIAAGKGFTTGKMSERHLDLYSRCYEINFRMVPKLFWDNQRAGGVSLFKRSMMRVLGKYEVRAWRSKFASVRRQIRERELTKV
ncbi:MAG: B12-binding domain-containing radical SAM protein [Anaerohalosphaera sp.]|nr:B12-binding domain-containing radical SAM protein [Anaerohalosphaera sp.]